MGHSYVRRLKEFIEKGSEGHFTDTLNIENTCSVHWHGVGGRTIQKVVQYDTPIITSLSPDILVLEIGSNDLCRRRSKPKEVATSVLESVKSFHIFFQVKFVIVCKITERSKIPYAKYNENVARTNRYLKLALEELDYAKFWSHRGLSCPTIDIFTRDGVHLNSKGNRALYRSYRGAILFGHKQLLKQPRL